MGEVFRPEAEVSPNPEAAGPAGRATGCFALLSDVPKTGEPAMKPRQVLETYKERHGVERCFAFLKGDAIVNSIFLEKESRVEAPGLVLLLALLIWRLVELDLDRHVAGAGGALDGWDKRRTRRPTAFMMCFKFAHVRVVRLGCSVRLLDPLSEVQREWLAAMNLGPSVFFGPKGAGRSP